MIFDLSGCLLRAIAAARTSSLRGTTRRCLSVLAGLALLPVNGCLGHHYVKTDFRSYENAFAETSNRELLLNLARLENRDPAYFFKLGQITSSYRMQGSLTTSGQLSAVTAPEGQVPTGGGTPGIIFENDPTFQYIPVNDDTNARLMMEPIQPETFYALYQQGWRLDQLFRLLVDRIEVSMPVPPPKDQTGQQKAQSEPQSAQTAQQSKQATQQSSKSECVVEVFRNVPPEGSPNNEPLAPGQVMKDATDSDGIVVGYYVVDAQGTPLYAITKDKKTRYNAVALSHYVTFLRVSALVYELQKRGLLVLRSTNQFVPYDGNSFIPLRSGGEKPSAQNEFPSWVSGGGSNGGNGGGSAFQAKDQNDAMARDQIWERKMSPDGKTQIGWILGHKVFTPVFYLTPIDVETTNGATTISSNTDFVEKEVESDLSDPELSAINPKGSTALTRVLTVMKEGFSLEGMPRADGEEEQNECPAEPTAHLYMRSIIGLMAASAQEQAPFEALANNDPPVTSDPQDRSDTSNPQPFQADVPRLEQMPVLRLQWRGVETVNPLVSVSYRGNSYSVTDPSPPHIEANATWNRDMFRLIEGLSSQVTVDISKFPLPEILQLHSD